MKLIELLAIPGAPLSTFVAESWRAARGESAYAGVPPVEPSLRIVGEAVLDRSFSVGINALTGVPRPAQVRRQRAELADAVAALTAQGYLENPKRYHAAPEAPRDWSLTAAHVRLGPRRTLYQELSFESDYEAPEAICGAERWKAHAHNRSAHAFVLEHRGAPRPWLVCVHGFGMGTAMSNFAGFRARWLHEDLGLNLIFPCLPLHGPRGASRISGRELLRPDYTQLLHCFAQGVWDLRRTLRWVRERGGERIGFYGVSLGAYHSAIVAGLEHELECVIAGIPAVDFPSVARDNEPWILSRYEEDYQVDWEAVRALTYVVSPLSFDPLLPRERRFIYAGTADRVARPDQARALWRHWDEPEIHWYPSGHVAGVWKASVHAFVERALRASQLVEPEAGRAPAPRIRPRRARQLVRRRAKPARR